MSEERRSMETMQMLKSIESAAVKAWLTAALEKLLGLGLRINLQEANRKDAHERNLLAQGQHESLKPW